MMSSTNGGAIGSSTGSTPSGVVEYARDDDWNVQPLYTAHAWFNGSLLSAWQAPRIKNTAVTDTTGSAAALAAIVTSLFNKLVIKADGSTVLPATAIKLRVTGANTTYASLGGTVLAELLLGCDGYGNLGDVVTVGANTYTVLTAGATTRLLVKNS